MRVQLADKRNGQFTFNFNYGDYNPLVKPIVHDLISSAFTEIYNKSFRNLDLDEFIKD